MGSTDLGVKQMVHKHSLVGGGLRGTKNTRPRPLNWPQTTTKGGGVEVICWEQGKPLPCSLLCGYVGPSKQNSKNMRKFSQINKVVEIKDTKYQTLKPKIKQVAGLQSLIKNWDCTIDFYENLDSWLFWVLITLNWVVMDYLTILKLNLVNLNNLSKMWGV